ncbi:hypothetical protein F4781DRAFT_432865 [Annulohypoxylon bovei var. microspora]|nr:hypothetical protein F4781DRAFT_432865 [Annulohypoxylon bovei var. microspora]
MCSVRFFSSLFQLYRIAVSSAASNFIPSLVSAKPSSAYRNIVLHITLQELLAPAEVRLYDHDWVDLGTKCDNAHTIGLATGIYRKSLEDPNSISLRSIAHKMKWDSDRETTRPEDRAYSLVGIFKANMPASYDEGGRWLSITAGKDRRFAMTTSEVSIFGWEDATHRDFYSMLAESPAAFASDRFRIRPRSTRSEKSRDPDVLGIFLRKIDTESSVRYNGNPPARYTAQQFRASPTTQPQTSYVALSLNDYHLRLNQALDRAIYVQQSTVADVFRTEPEAAWDCERSLFFSRPHDDFATGVSLKISSSDLPKDARRKIKANILFDRRKDPPACFVIDPSTSELELSQTGGRQRRDEIEDRDQRFKVSAALEKNEDRTSDVLEVRTSLVEASPSLGLATVQEHLSKMMNEALPHNVVQDWDIRGIIGSDEAIGLQRSGLYENFTRSEESFYGVRKGLHRPSREQTHGPNRAKIEDPPTGL